MSTTRDLYQLALEALPKARAPYSNFKVACVPLKASSECITASNIKNVSFPMPLYAKKNVIIHTARVDHQRITEAALFVDQSAIDSPHRGYRQCCNEFSTPNLNINL